MVIDATGIVIDHYGDVLLIQRDDTRTLAPPGGAAEIGELPTETVQREVKEETGLIVMPVRLVGVYYLQTNPENYLSFYYRCIMRGGEIKKSHESLQAGFFKTNPLPSPMLNIHKKRINDSMAHHDGSPILRTTDFPLYMKLGKWFLKLVVYPWLGFRRRQKGLEPYQAPPQWHVKNYLMIKDKEGRILWTQSAANGSWALPSIDSQAGEAPWDTAVRTVSNVREIDLKITRLAGVYPDKVKPEIALIYTATINHGQPILHNNGLGKFFLPGKEPPAAHRGQMSWLNQALKNRVDVHCERANLP